MKNTGVEEIWHDKDYVEHYIKDVTDQETNWYEYGVNLPDMVRLIPDSTQTLLDFGCGAGDITDMLAKQYKSVEGADASAKMLQYAKQQFPQTHFIEWDGLTDPPEQLSRYDCIFSKLTFQFISDLDTLAARLSAILNPDGCIVISVPHPAMTARRIGNASYWLPVNYSRMLQDHDFRITMIHRSLEAYLNPFLTRGFKLTALSEPGIPDRLIHEHAVKKYEHTGLPRRLNIRLSS